ncbi:MAG: hypothetical protein EOO60_12400 [Hymenobacter sp.]|nr:MAG: hypothetical protein EOO60_12400 [Hymenobacter sp.]
MVAALATLSAFAQTGDGYQRSYTRRDGTPVQGSTHTRANGTNTDNYSTQGNTNPYTGTSGSRAQDYSAPASNYGSGAPVQTGSRGGQYYINSKGAKVYLKASQIRTRPNN